jgi:hypothetical protein
MIFNEMNTTTVSHEAVQESPYDLGIGGALMHVYENECNYNALMKAAALSEMKYYNENGGDLFVQEAGAFGSFVEKVKAFFKKVIEKIKSIAKKFMATINQFTMKDKDFVKKYQNDLVRKNLKDFEFNGYKFPAWTGNTSTDGAVSDVKGDGSDDNDALNDIIEKNRGKIVGGAAMTESEFRDELKEKLYGDKEDIENINIRTYLSIISESSKVIKAAEKEEKDIIKGIEDIIKKIEKFIKTVDKSADTAVKNNMDKVAQDADNAIKGHNNKITVYKALSNDLTVYFGAVTKALADKNRQAKAICVKALSYNYKNESATLEEGSYSNIFDDVAIV